VVFVPAGRDETPVMLSANEHEEVFAKLYTASKHVHFQIKTTEGQHYQRFLLWQRVKESHERLTEAEVIPSLPKGVNDGKIGIHQLSRRGLPQSVSSTFRWGCHSAVAWRGLP